MWDFVFSGGSHRSSVASALSLKILNIYFFFLKIPFHWNIYYTIFATVIPEYLALVSFLIVSIGNLYFGDFIAAGTIELNICIGGPVLWLIFLII